ncbi:MAG: T9SS type A sorting domain-containing protein [Flavobacteriaceae bacterium]
MNYKLRIACLFLLFFGFSYSQNQSWGSYFSYNHIIDLTHSESRIFAATENALFSQNLVNYEIQTINSIDGLKSENITTVYHSIEFGKTFIGNSNGLLIVINHSNNNQIINKVDIINNVPVPQTLKRINHFFEYNQKIYIATDYGITVFNPSTLEFGDTYFIGLAGQETQVLQTTVFDGYIYAVTPGIGLRRALISNPNLIHFNSWEIFDSGSWKGVASVGNFLVASTTDNHLYRFSGTTQIPVINTNQTMLSVRSENGYLTVTTASTVYVLNHFMGLVAQIGQIFGEPLQYTSSLVKGNTLYIGSRTKGIFSINLNNQGFFENYIPEGPIRNTVYSIKATATDLWCVFGYSNYQNNPYAQGLSQFGISKLTSEGWLHIPYEDVLEARSLSKVILQPNNENVAYIGSNFSGILKVENNVPTELYNQHNTGQNGLETFYEDGTSDVRIHNLAYDRSNNLWATNAGIGGKLKVLRTSGNWQSYNITEGPSHFGDLVIDKNNTKWVASVLGLGVIGFNDTHQNRKIVIDDSYGNGLPINNVKTLAIDKNNRLWIGTQWGLRILPSVDRFLTEDQPSVNPVIIMEDGLAQELLYRQNVSKIKIDGADQKWLGTMGAGVFLVSPNGQETIYHFTKDNSPLPSNTILDIDINPQTGEVFFATDKGMVSYKGASTAPSDNLAGVYVYPNPVRPEYSGTVKVTGLTDQANVKITDIEGNLVFEANSSGGTVEWDTTAFGRYRVASGVYMIFIATRDATETKVKKVMIVR